MFLREHLQYFCEFCNASTPYCIKCNKALEVLLHCAYFRCFHCKCLVKRTKVEAICSNSNESLQLLFKNNNQDMQFFQNYFGQGNQTNNSLFTPFNNQIVPSTSQQVTGIWTSDKRSSGSKGNFIVMSKEKEVNAFNVNDPLPNPHLLNANTPEKNKENKENIFMSNDRPMMNITEEAIKRCNISLEEQFGNSVDMKFQSSNNIFKPKSLLRQVVEETSSKIQGNKKFQANPRYNRNNVSVIKESPQKMLSASKLDSSLFSAYNKNESRLSKSPSMSQFKEIKESAIKEAPDKSYFSAI